VNLFVLNEFSVYCMLQGRYHKESGRSQVILEIGDQNEYMVSRINPSEMAVRPVYSITGSSVLHEVKRTLYKIVLELTRCLSQSATVSKKTKVLDVK
jgi:hypothetical protein